MTFLLDTHVLLWALSDPARLSAEASSALLDPVNRIVASAVTAWEIAIKQSLGKITLPGAAERWLPEALERTGIGWLDVTARDALRVRALPWHHRDPFDRLLIAQVRDGMALITHDERLRPYGVRILWT